MLLILIGIVRSLCSLSLSLKRVSSCYHLQEGMRKDMKKIYQALNGDSAPVPQLPPPPPMLLTGYDRPDDDSDIEMMDVDEAEQRYFEEIEHVEKVPMSPAIERFKERRDGRLVEVGHD